MSDEIDALLEKAAELVYAGQAAEAESIYQETHTLRTLMGNIVSQTVINLFPT